MSKIRLSHNENNIVLVGHMGSGKSVFGRKIANHFNVKHIDTDQEIEDESKMTITELFEKKDEKCLKKKFSIIASKAAASRFSFIRGEGGKERQNEKTK